MALRIAVASFLLLFLQCEAVPIANVRDVRQAVSTLVWTTSEWSECSATCGGGLRTRSVRCLDEDGVISTDCSTGLRPASYEFCAQIDCTTAVPTPNVLPASREYQWASADGSFTTLDFNNQGGGFYTVRQNTTESDLTTSIVEETVTPTQRTRNTQVLGRDNTISVIRSDNDFSVVANGNNILRLNDIQTLRFEGGQGINYNGGTISGLDSMIIAPNVNRLTYYDGFRFYEFTSDLINPLMGPGTLYYNPITGEAVYSIELGFNQRLDNAIATIIATPGPQATPIPITNAPPQPMTPAPATEPPAPEATQPQPTAAPQTPAPQPQTEPEEPITVRPVEPSTDEPQGPATDPEEPGVIEETTRSRGRSPKTRSRSRGRSRSRSEEVEAEEPEENECTKKTCKTRKSRGRGRSQVEADEERSRGRGRSRSRSRSNRNEEVENEGNIDNSRSRSRSKSRRG